MVRNERLLCRNNWSITSKFYYTVDLIDHWLMLVKYTQQLAGQSRARLYCVCYLNNARRVVFVVVNFWSLFWYYVLVIYYSKINSLVCLCLIDRCLLFFLFNQFVCQDTLNVPLRFRQNLARCYKTCLALSLEITLEIDQPVGTEFKFWIILWLSSKATELWKCFRRS